MTTTKRRFSTREVRALIVAASLAGTLGLWNLFATEASEQALLEPTATAIPVTEGASQVVLELPPLPTLVALETSALGWIAPPPVEAVTAVPTSQPPPARIFLGGSKPQPQKPEPAARTRSSR